MLRSCKYCGRVHDEDYVCKKKPIVKKKIDAAVKLRNTADWKNMRDKIKRRDKYFCQICIRELYGTWRKYNCEALQVHHAIPINSNDELKLEDSNLITLCSMHHSMCDKGQIPYEEVKRIIDEQENKKREFYVNKYMLKQCPRLKARTTLRTPHTDSPTKFTTMLTNVSFLERN